jgi:hypothetical protein
MLSSESFKARSIFCVASGDGGSPWKMVLPNSTAITSPTSPHLTRTPTPKCKGGLPEQTCATTLRLLFAPTWLFDMEKTLRRDIQQSGVLRFVTLFED